MTHLTKAAARSRTRSAAVITGLFAALPAFAQVDPSQLPGQTRQDIDPASRVPAVQPRAIDPSMLAQPSACPFAGQGSLTLSRIVVTGATLVPQADVDAAVADLVGTTADAGVLCTARDRVAAVYARRGEALARVDLPGQRITDGVLTLRVTEGRIVDTVIENREAMGPSAALADAYLARLEAGGATRWADVERAFLLTRDIPGADVRFGMRRADDGSADGLVAGVTFAPRRKLDLTVSAQNFGSEELGRNGASVRADANGFTPFGERTSLVLFSSFSGAQRVVQLMEEFRVGASGWTVLGDVAWGRSEPEGGLAPLELEGRSRVARLGARYPLVRSRAANIDAGVRVEAIDQTNDLGFLRSFGLGTIPLFDEDLRVLAFELASRWQPRGMPGFGAAFGVELRQGLDAFGASQPRDPLLSRAEARPDFTSARVNLSARWAMLPYARVSPYVLLAGSGQWASDPLPAYEEFQVGNYTIGRGFDPGAASGDRALAAQGELGVDFAGTAYPVSVFGFVDAAHVRNKDAGSYDSEPWSAGVGARVRWRQGQFALTWAKPQTEAIPGQPVPEARVLATFNHAFSIR